MQLVLSNNRVIAHGENFIAMGGTVINTVTGVKYENATVAECAGCPSDIDSVGYEYHAGQFIPCAPYGKGYGNLAVLCDRDCKAIKDSGKPLSELFFVNLLWENASPNSSFGTQTVTLSSDNWDFLLVESLGNGTTILTSSSKGQIRHNTGDTTQQFEYIRDLEATSTTGVKITACRKISFGVSSDSVNVEYNLTNLAKPLRIYGIKLGVTV